MNIICFNNIIMLKIDHDFTYILFEKFIKLLHNFDDDHIYFIDISQCQFIDSSGIGMILMAFDYNQNIQISMSDKLRQFFKDHHIIELFE